MLSDAVATVVALWRYPVKSMMGEQLNAAEVTDRGLLGDRAYALVDRETGKVASAKFPRKWPTLLAHRATYVYRCPERPNRVAFDHDGRDAGRRSGRVL